MLVVIGLQTLLAAVSQHQGWHLWNLSWWAWFVIVGPEAVLLVPLAWSRPRHQLEQLGKRRMFTLLLFAVVSIGNGCTLIALIGSLLMGHEDDGAELLYKGLTIWTANMIAFGLWYWTFDRGGPGAPARAEPAAARFPVPADGEPGARAAGLASAAVRLHLRLVHELDRVQPDRRDAPDAPGQGADADPVELVGDDRAARGGEGRQHPALTTGYPRATMAADL